MESEATFAGLVERLVADADRREQLTELLREEHPLYEQRGTATTVRMRGWILLALARTGVPDEALLFVLEELESGVDPYLVAAAARALRSYPRPKAAFAPLLLRALGNIRFRDERVSLDRYGAYAVGPVGTTPVRELLATLAWLGPHARAVRADLELLRQDRGLARKYGDDLDAALAAIRGGDDAAEHGADSCCELPGGIQGSRWWPFANRAGAEDVEGVGFEDHDGTASTFKELFRGRVSIVVFFYTRCDNPLKCSLTVSKLARVQQLLEERGLAGRIATAAITYDPAFDVPERLRVYGKDRRVRMDGDHRMLRAVDGLDTLRRYFGLGVNFIESLVNRHRIEAYVLDAEGRIAASFERLQWDEEALVDRSVAVMEEQRETEPEAPAKAGSTKRKVAFPMLATMASIALAFFPKCPVCWAAYLSLFGVAGLNQIPYSPWLQPAIAALVLVNVATVWLRGRATRRLTGFYLVTAGALVTLSSVTLGWKSVSAIGIILTMAGSLVSARRLQSGSAPSRVSRARGSGGLSEELLPRIADPKIPG
ncbi:MAG TPA: SCO family protein [Thermoanaerobaculia bacterium]